MLAQTYLTPSRNLSGAITIPGSKSITNRALLLAALADGPSELQRILFSDDTEVFLEALVQLRIEHQVSRADYTCRIEGCAGRFPARLANIWCNDAGTTLRFLLAACAAMQGHYHFDGSSQLQQRPLTTLIKSLSGQGAAFAFKAADYSLPLTVSHASKLSGGKISVPVSESSQFISGLLMAGPYAAKPMVLRSTEIKSASYIDMTCKMMESFGVRVDRSADAEYLVPQTCYRGRTYSIEPDLSTASYFFAAAALTPGTIVVKNTDLNSTLQGDREFLGILALMGCVVTNTIEGICVKGPAQLKGVNVSMRNCSDTFMTLACLAPFAAGPTTITDIGHTRFKECDRIEAVRENLTRLGVRVELPDEDSIVIFPGVPEPAVLDSYNDHRIVMSFALIGLKINNIVIVNPGCVKKTCPDFFSLWQSMFE
jgi:3-phosphoshikimate 1-carboxyvinyltransferase